MREDWIIVEIENIFKKLENGKDLNQGWSPQCKNHPSPSNDVWGVLKTTAIQKNEFWDYENKELPKDKEVRSHLEVKVGDILLTCAGPRNRCGVACTVNKTRPKLLLSGKMYRFRPEEEAISTQFLSLFLQTQEAWLAIDKMKTGTSDSGLNLTHSRFRKLKIPIAPLPIQRAIVSKIETLFSDLDKGIEDLNKAKDQLVIYRQAVLKKAFHGELTGVKLERVRIDSLGKIVTGNTPPKNDDSFYNSRDYNFYKPTDLEKGLNVFESNDYLSQKGFENSRKVPENSILVTCIGATIGKTGLVRKPGGFNQQINAIVPESSINPKFIFFQAISLDFQTQIKTNASSTTLPILNKKKFSSLTMQFCSPKEQHRIVREIESRFSICDQVEQSIEESLEKAKALRQSILKKAFEGTLLTKEEIEKCKTEKDYEPAAVLLERIRKEKKK